MTATILSDVIAAQKGDRAAFGQVVEQFEPTVFAIVLKRLGNRSEALEVTQDVFIRALRKIDQLSEPAAFPGWIKQIAIRTAINRAVRRAPETATAPENFGALAATNERSPFDGLVDAEQAEAVRDSLSKLKDIDRSTLLAFYFDGQSVAEMADAFAVPVGTIKRRLHTARARLKEHLVDLVPA